MDSSNSTGLNFYVADLVISDFDEDRDLALHAGKVIMALVDTLKPVLKYVTSPWTFAPSDTGGEHYKVARVIGHELDRVEGPGRKGLCIDQDGKFLLIQVSEKKNRLGFPAWQVIRVDSTGAWPQFTIAEVITGLQRLLAEAERKREENLKTITAHRQKLDQILAVLKK